MRGFAISFLMPLKIAFADSLFEVLLAMIDDHTLCALRTVNKGHLDDIGALCRADPDISRNQRSPWDGQS
jgi:hypothetical protein